MWAVRSLLLAALGLCACQSDSAPGAARVLEPCASSKVAMVCDSQPCPVVGAIDVTCSAAPVASFAAGPKGVAYLAEGIPYDSKQRERLLTLKLDGDSRAEGVYRQNQVVASDAAGAPFLFGTGVAGEPHPEWSPPGVSFLNADTWRHETIFDTGTVKAAGVAPDGTLKVAFDVVGPILGTRTPAGVWSTRPLVPAGHPRRVFFDETGAARVLSVPDCELGGAPPCLTDVSVTEERDGGGTRVVAKLGGFDDVTFAPSAAGGRYVFSGRDPYPLPAGAHIDVIDGPTATSLHEPGAPWPESTTCVYNAQCSGDCTGKHVKMSQTGITTTSDGATWMAYVRTDVDQDLRYAYVVPTGTGSPSCVLGVTADRSTATLVLVRLALEPTPSVTARFDLPLGPSPDGRTWQLAARLVARGTDLLVLLGPNAQLTTRYRYLEFDTSKGG